MISRVSTFFFRSDGDLKPVHLSSKPCLRYSSRSVLYRARSSNCKTGKICVSCYWLMIEFCSILLNQLFFESYCSVPHQVGYYFDFHLGSKISSIEGKRVHLWGSICVVCFFFVKWRLVVCEESVMFWSRVIKWLFYSRNTHIKV